MLRGVLNLGILAHVDAGKTTLTERLLYCAGVIDEPGSVDDGTTQTDSLALERQRGITIKSAVVSFTVGGTAVNLIDTPGHPDFVAEVERALSVLDGVVLVVSAVEGVRGLTPAIVPMGSVRGLGTPGAAFVPSGHGDQAFGSRLAEVYFGSAITGAGAGALMRGLADLLPVAGGTADGPVSGRVFKIERGHAGERTAYARMFSATMSSPCGRSSCWRRRHGPARSPGCRAWRRSRWAT